MERTRPAESPCSLLLLASALSIALSSCGDRSDSVADGESAPAGSAPASGFRAVSAQESGIRFANRLTETLEFNFMRYPYIYNGGGVATGDFDNDGKTDIYFTSNQGSNKLYRNLGNLRFEDVTNRAGVADAEHWTTGVSLVDINADGFLDIHVCKSGSVKNEPGRRNKLFINNGDLTFTERAAAHGLADGAFSTQAYFFDLDRDGDLDMYLVNHRPDFTNTGRISTSLQRAVSPETSDKLYRNDDGRFTDITIASGITNKTWGLSAVISDFDEDGWEDVYVCNDFLEADHLFTNNGDGTFSNSVGSIMDHISFYSMGSDMADIDNDGRPDLLVVDMAAADHVRSKRNMASMSNSTFWAMVGVGYQHQYMSNMLHRNNGGGDFSEIGNLAGVSKTDWSWAPLLADFDNDGLRDLYITNGIKRDITDNDYQNELQAVNQAGQGLTLEQLFELVPAEKVSNEMFRNSGELDFDRVTTSWGLNQRMNSNGAAYADLDDDGDLDLVVNNIDDRSLIYENLNGGNHLAVELLGPGKNPQGLGTRVRVQTAGSIQQHQQYLARGFQSSVDPVLHFGLGDATTVDSVTIEWPDGKVQVLRDVAANRRLKAAYSDSEAVEAVAEPETCLLAPLPFGAHGLGFTHVENPYDDFLREILLPQKQSTLGPAASVGDVNGDGLDDLFLGGAHTMPASLFLQQPDGSFEKNDPDFWDGERAYEDTASLLLDCDGDGDLDLYVVSGGSEFELGSPLYQDRLYRNDGQGEFSQAKSALPEIAASGGCVVPADVDGDGDEDLFVGGRTLPGHYPYAPRSYFLENDEGVFTDATAERAPEFAEVGMVTDAVFSDFDGDGSRDLVVVGEWMEVLFFRNAGGQLKRVSRGIEDSGGWWYSIAAADFDGDGDDDYVLGNLGLNNKFHADAEKPFHVYAADLDNTGNNDIVLGKEGRGTLLPVRGRECSSQQMPFIAEKFPTFRNFAEACLDDIYGEDALQSALHYQVQTFATSYLENRGDGQLVLTSLPASAQFGPTIDSRVLDVNGDGHLDILGAGSIYNAEVETTRYDASKGYVLLGDSAGGFTALPNSGLLTQGNVKRLVLLEIRGQAHLVVVANDGPLQLYRLER